MVDDQAIATLLRQHGAMAGCDALLSAALRAGGVDNVSCITVALEPHSTSSRCQ
jgi:serine/threonine protein phosphatase PrpC